MNRTNRPELRSWTHMWFGAAVRQLERATWTGVGSAAPETFLYVDCMRNAYRGAERLLGSDHPEVVRFMDAVPHVKDLRDMLQHFEEYIDGKGRLQRSGAVDVEWPIYASGDINSNVRRVHVQGMVIELPGAHEALAQLVDAALEETGGSIRSVSNGRSDRP
ncbi:hypothetical protein GCM10009740_37010 [Terrabacter terrae]|uniref:Uncharacterized protein n=1 Tax=Terrabacter terrae TaxID=318434 RepID=A0ABN2UN85_9MICO